MGDAGVGHHGVQRAVQVLHRRHQGFGLVRVGYVQMVVFGLSALGDYVGGNRGALLLKNVGHDHAVVGVCERPGGSRTDTDAGSRDQNGWISEGTHIAALGADKEGDQELDPEILKRARIFVDDIRQCRTDGEINVPLRKGMISEDDVVGEIGQVVAGKLEGRISDSDITVFDSTGFAIQDSATVPLEYERALAAGVGVEKKMIST